MNTFHWFIIPALLLLFGCTPEPKIITQTQIIEKDIQIVNRPSELSLIDVNFRVVAKDTVGEFEASFEGKPEVFLAITIKDYENLAKNIAELKRYITDQQSIIQYYENSVQTNSPTP